MTKHILTPIQKKCFTFCIYFFFSFVGVHAQTPTTSINVGSAVQLTGTPFQLWTISAVSPGMTTNICFGNTTGPIAPPVGGVGQVFCATTGQAAPVVTTFAAGWPAGTYLSCFTGNTIYNLLPAVNNNLNTTMTIRRRFNVCSNNNEMVNFNLSSITCDNNINSVVVDAGTVGAVTLPLPSAPPVFTIPGISVTGSVLLSPGPHTLDITCANWEQTNGSNFVYLGQTYQWNPFGVSIVGTISSVNTVLLDDSTLGITPITGPTTVCAGSAITLANATPGGTWTSSNTTVASVDPSGVVTGNTPGNATINYNITQGSCQASASYNITVTDCHCEDSCNWSLTGNTLVKPWNFIGSLNNADFKIRTNNTQRMVVSAAGDVGINTTAPAKLLDVNGEARISTLPSSAVNDRIVFANASGDLKSLAASGNTSQYLSGNGTWQNITGGGTINAGQGLTIDLNTIHLGDRCGMGGGQFTEHREVNMNNSNLYFNSSDEGKIFIGSTGRVDVCRPLVSRLEISTQGLTGAANDYSLSTPSTSGLRFTDLTGNTTPIKENVFKGVLSLDEEGDVIWVTACCDKGGIEEPQLKTILERLTKLENEVKESKAESARLKSQLAQMDVILSKTNTIVLNQNVPNPFSESTVITYSIPKYFSKAQIIFSTITGEVIKTADIKNGGKGQVNVFANDISSGIYTYTLVIDGKQVETKKMIRQ